MHRFGRYVASLLILGLWGCWAASADLEPADQRNLVFKTFYADGKRFLALLPPDMENVASESKDETAIFKPNRSVLRTIRFIQLSPLDSLEIDQYSNSISLKSGATLRYKTFTYQEAGSGGPEAELIGFLDFDTYQVSVQCHDQDEWRPEPHWCIPFLHYIRVLDPS